MSLRHAANRFRLTVVDGWDGFNWIPAVGSVSVRTGSRSVSEAEGDTKLRGVLMDPRSPLPPNIQAIRFGTPPQIYLVGRTVTDIKETAYSAVLALRLCYYTCSIDVLTTQTAASGMKIAPSRQTLGQYFCDRENASYDSTKNFPTVKFGDDVLILPAGTSVTVANEAVVTNLQGVIQGTYVIQEVYEFGGLIYCRCLVRPTPQTDTPWVAAMTMQTNTTGVLEYTPSAPSLPSNTVTDSEGQPILGTH